MRTRIAAWLFAFGWLILSLAACSDPPASALRLGSTLWTYQGASGVFTAAWSPGGQYLALGEADGTVQVRDALRGTLAFSLYGHTAAVWALAWSPGGKRLATASWDGTVRVWDTATGHLLLIYRGHTGEVLVVPLGWLPDAGLQEGICILLTQAQCCSQFQDQRSVMGKPISTFPGPNGVAMNTQLLRQFLLLMRSRARNCLSKSLKLYSPAISMFLSLLD